MSLYETDINEWVEQQVKLIKQKQYAQVDWDNIIEEIEDLSKRERDKFLSAIRLIIHHLLKWEYQPEKRSNSWLTTIRRERNNLTFYLEDTPSLKKYWTGEEFERNYRRAKADAVNETGLSEWHFPEKCPYSVEQIRSSWLPD
ncbi:MAG: DUF29 domain-containing protein [Crocosphaera sp.]|nr:DUF29 domain-containing protein [Crocosphaera sp.]